MKFTPAYKNALQPTLGAMGAFCLLSLILIGGYLYVNYHRYLASYNITQQSDLKSAQDKINLNVENIKKLSALTVKRILASSGNIQRIQNILTSTHSLLPDRDFLKLQKVTYEKLSRPQCLITRFGVTSLDSSKRSLDMPDNRGSSIIFGKESIYSKAGIFMQEGQPYPRKKTRMWRA